MKQTTKEQLEDKLAEVKANIAAGIDVARNLKRKRYLEERIKQAG